MAFNSLELYIAGRFLRKGRFQTLLIILGIASGVAVQFFLLALIGGLQASLIEKTIGAAPQITILPAESFPRALSERRGFSDFRRPARIAGTEIISWEGYLQEIRDNSEISAATPVAGGTGTIEKRGALIPVQIKGILLADGNKIYKLKRNLTGGKLDLAGDQALIPLALAEKLALAPGDQFFMRNQNGDGSYFVVAGTFDLGSSATERLVFLNLNRARNFLNLTGVNSLEIQVTHIFEAQRIARGLARDLTRVRIESWQEKNRELLSGLSAQSSSSGVIQFFIIFSITLGIASVLAIAAVQKSRQLGILKAMGITNHSAALIFIWQGFLMGLGGSLLGILIGVGLAEAFIVATSQSGNSFGLQINLTNLLLPVCLAIVSATAASVIPAQKALHLKPMEVIRNG